MSSDRAALSYEEPGIVTILILSSFLLLLNTVNYLLDRIVYCGLIGQIFIGVAFGVPGLNWLSRDVQNAVMQLGYLGLILIVYEGGLATNLQTLKANFFLSATVALIGISAPVGLSFILQRLLDITALQAFAAGTALCSTSLGTTFTVLSTSGLTDSRLGVVLSSAAMMDDMVGLVMVQVISSLGTSTDFQASTIVRPIGVSIAFAVVVPLICWSIVKPLTKRYHAAASTQAVKSSIQARQAMLVLHTLVLLVLVTGASYAGTSNLFAAYLAGAVISWWDGLYMEMRNTCDTPSVGETKPQEPAQPEPIQVSDQTQDAPQTASLNPATSGQPPTITPEPTSSREEQTTSSGIMVYEHYYNLAVGLVLKPFFFASL